MSEKIQSIKKHICPLDGNIVCKRSEKCRRVLKQLANESKDESNVPCIVLWTPLGGSPDE